MRTLIEIIDDVKTGGKPDYEELRYTVLALDFLGNMDHHDLTMDINQDTKPFILKMFQEESFRRMKTALHQDPKEYVGWNNDPENPEYQKRLGLANRLFDRAMKGELP